MALEAFLRGGRPDLGHRAHLPRPHHLVFVEKEDGDACDVDELLDLRPAGAVGGRSIAVG